MIHLEAVTTSDANAWSERRHGAVAEQEERARVDANWEYSVACSDLQKAEESVDSLMRDVIQKEKLRMAEKARGGDGRQGRRRNTHLSRASFRGHPRMNKACVRF